MDEQEAALLSFSFSACWGATGAGRDTSGSWGRSGISKDTADQRENTHIYDMYIQLVIQIQLVIYGEMWECTDVAEKEKKNQTGFEQTYNHMCLDPVVNINLSLHCQLISWFIFDLLSFAVVSISCAVGVITFSFAGTGSISNCRSRCSSTLEHPVLFQQLVHWQTFSYVFVHIISVRRLEACCCHSNTAAFPDAQLKKVMN